jgi:hypothetical protein
MNYYLIFFNYGLSSIGSSIDCSYSYNESIFVLEYFIIKLLYFISLHVYYDLSNHFSLKRLSSNT